MRNLVCIYDKKSSIYDSFGFFESEDVAIRMGKHFFDLRGNDLIYQFPSDFCLVVVGFIDDAGNVTGCDHRIIFEFGSLRKEVGDSNAV